ncbi:uncharacterized protein LOC143773462 [Ranitomeya variabilis]|uniref:uncharacterized protein LOC143773462 n=1 Tax=Ranitomeya variabilis TaxID=490064 RepID=UPI004055B141
MAMGSTHSSRKRTRAASPQNSDVSSSASSLSRSPSPGAYSEHDSEYESDVAPDQESPEFQESIDSLIEAVNHTLKIDEVPCTNQDHPVSFKHTKRPHRVLGNHPEYTDIITKHRSRPDKRFLGLKPLEACYPFSSDLRKDWTEPPAAKRMGKTKHIQCALCSQPLPDNYLKKLCQSCIESTLCEESSVRSEDIRSMIREELQAFRSSEKIPEGRKKYNSPRSEQSSETEDKDSDGSQRIISSDDERDTCFPTDSIDNLVRSVCNTMGIEDTKIPKTPQDVMFAGLSERKKPSFPVIPAIKNVVKKEWESQGQRGLPSSSKRRYPFNDEDFSIWLKAPKVDAAVASTSKKSLLPVEDSGSLQDPLDRKADTLLKRAWESCTGAFRPAISATCTARSMLVWLNDLEEGLKSGLSRDRLISSLPLIRGATAFLADSSADSIRLAAKSAGLTNAARRALWLKVWKGDPQTKSKLCGLPCQGERSVSPRLIEERTIKTKTAGLIKTLSRKERFSENVHSNLRIKQDRSTRLATAPRVFTKVMAAVMSILHSRGAVILPYLDDLLVKGPSYRACEESVTVTIDTLSSRLAGEHGEIVSSSFPASPLFGDDLGHFPRDKVVLRTSPSFLPKVVSTFHLNEDIVLTSFCSAPVHRTEKAIHTLVLVRYLGKYIS